MNNSLKYFAFSMLLAAMTGCAEDITQTVGSLPDETPMNSLGGQLYSGRTFSHKITVGIYEGDEPATEKIGYAITKPATTAVTVKAIPSPALVAEYNQNNNTKMEEFPIANVTLENDGSITIPIGKKVSDNINITLSSEGLNPETTYLLAITLAQNPTGLEICTDKQVIYYRINYREKITTCIPGTAGQIQEIPPLLPDVTTVFYVNTETYQPLIIRAWGVVAEDYVTQPKPIYSLGNIINLKKATISYDADSRRTKLELGADLSYVLENRDKYIRHLQEYNRKVCLCIENGGKGIGFCNMNDTQIADFVQQVKDVIVRYQLDGINLWDEDSKYGKADMPQINTTSYPKLIKTLREAMPDKLLTLVDKGNVTKYFYDVNKCGGIEVGKYLDYAWHGYFSSTGEIELINPKMDDNPQPYSQYTRKPIAGLDEKHYGSVNIPRYSVQTPAIRQAAADKITQWKTLYKKSDILVFGDDLIGNEYGDRENAVRIMLTEYSFLPFMDDGDRWDFNKDELIWGDIEYSGISLDPGVENPAGNSFLKDW